MSEPKSHWRRIVTLLLMAVGFTSLPGCATEAHRECDKYADFFKLSISEREIELPRHSLEEQVNLCICGMYREPPTTYLAYALADEGLGVIPLLLQRLEASKDEAGKRNIIYIFKILSLDGLLKGREDVVVEMQKVVGSMKDELIRSSSQAALVDIEANVNKK